MGTKGCYYRKPVLGSEDRGSGGVGGLRLGGAGSLLTTDTGEA